MRDFLCNSHNIVPQLIKAAEKISTPVSSHYIYILPSLIREHTGMIDIIIIEVGAFWALSRLRYIPIFSSLCQNLVSLVMLSVVYLSVCLDISFSLSLSLSLTHTHTHTHTNTHTLTLNLELSYRK